MKICYVIESMFNSGGMENVLSVCATELSKYFEVSILTICQNSRDYYFPLNKNIRCYDLEIDIIGNKHIIKTRLKDFLLSHSFDIVISLGGIDMYCLHSINDRSKKIVWFHFAYNVAYTAWLGDSPSFIKKIRGYLQHVKRIFNARKYDKIVVISSADKKAWGLCSNKVVLIYNPVTIANPIISDRQNKSVIAVGRLDYAKGFDYLINAWKLVSQKHSDWILDIYGEGTLREQLQRLIDKLDLADSVNLRGRSYDIVKDYSQHSFCVMSSRSEALGLVLLEASLCGLPLVAYDCSGPRDIIEDGKNGFLIKKIGDIETLSSTINQLIENTLLRKRMGENALKQVEKFSIKEIINQWKRLFDEVMAM